MQLPQNDPNLAKTLHGTKIFLRITHFELIRAI